MKDPRTDDERLSALLDGRLEEQPRQEMLAHLAASDDDYEVFADTASILRELEAEDAARRGAAPPREEEADSTVSTPVIPIDRGRRRRWGAAARWGALAAVLAAVALFGVLSSRSGDAAAGSPVSLAARLERAGEGLPEGWTRRPPWSATRGDGAPGALSPGEREARAARAGALMVDLAVAVRARDAVSTRTLAEQVRSRFAPRLTGADNPFRRITERAGAPPDSLAGLLDEANGWLAERWGREPLRLGAWTEAARLAAERRDAAFFRDDTSGDVLDRAERLAGTDPGGRLAVERVRAALAGEGPPDWGALSPALDTLLREIAS